MHKASVTAVGHTGITVSDMNKSVHFYRDILGFECSVPVHVGGDAVGEFTGVSGAQIDLVFVRAPGHMIELLHYSKPEKRETSRLRPCDNGILHFCFKVLDIDAMVAAMRTAGFEIIGRIQDVTEGPNAGARAVYTRDPDGVHIELIQDRPGVIFEETFF